VTFTRTQTTCRYYLDCEFIEDGSTIDLGSIGIVSSDGRQLYLESDECDWSKASDWVEMNVIPHLSGEHPVTRPEMAEAIREFVSLPNVRPEFWSWCAAYDWVAICQLYGPMVAKPEGWPNYCRDLQQELDRFGIEDSELPPHPGLTHNALADAHWHRDIHLWLMDNVDV
jgi:hypothetical protein